MKDKTRRNASIFGGKIEINEWKERMLAKGKNGRKVKWKQMDIGRVINFCGLWCPVIRTSLKALNIWTDVFTHSGRLDIFWGWRWASCAGHYVRSLDSMQKMVNGGTCPILAGATKLTGEWWRCPSNSLQTPTHSWEINCVVVYGCA